jgi:hypothetical protein
MAKTYAGFKPDQPYFVARTHVELEEEIEYYANLLLPELARWRRERKSRFGDKSTCSDVFLNQLIPYLVEVLM